MKDEAASTTEQAAQAVPAPAVEKSEPVRLDLVEKHRYEQSEKLMKAQVKNLTECLATARGSPQQHPGAARR